MICKSIEQARRIAQANADQTGKTWVTFFDTSGNAHCEQYQTQNVENQEYFNPKKYPPAPWQPDQNAGYDLTE